MQKMRGCLGNRGSSIVEMSLIMPIILWIIFLTIWLHLDTIKDGLVQQDGYSTIYTYKPEKTEGVIKNHNYIYEEDGHVFITEVDVCSDRLRRWQVYGNIVWE